jgi:hypothetical protein
MPTKRLISWVKQNIQLVDWDLLVLLLFFLNVKLVVKLAALAFVLIRRRHWSFRFSIKPPGIPLFYPLMIGIAVMNLLFYGLYRDANYLVLLAAGIGSWLLCMVAFQQTAFLINQQETAKLHATIGLFFLLNAGASFANLLSIVWETGAFNPYRYQGNYQKYFIGTGDYIRGISFNTSTTNAILNAFAIVYFLNRKRIMMSLLCMVVLLLTYSNFANLLVIAALLWMFIFMSDRNQKTIIVVQFALLVVFMTNISPQNNKYAADAMSSFFRSKTENQKPVKFIPIEQRPDSVLNRDEKKYKIAHLWLDSMNRVRTAMLEEKEQVKPEIPKANIHAPEYQHRQDSSETRMKAIAYLADLKRNEGAQLDTSILQSKTPGKLIAFRQLLDWSKTHTGKIMTGNGLGNFSSKIAFRAAGIKTSGGYPDRFHYLHDDFRNGALFVYLDYASRDSKYHSVTNLPYSFYTQLPGEYGIAGFVCFLLFYLGYFFRGSQRNSYAIPVMLIMVAAFAVDYWFEQLSVVIVFEIFMLLDLKEKRENKIPVVANE